MADITIPSAGDPETEEFQRSPEYQKYLKTCRRLVTELLDSQGISNLNEVTDPNERKELQEKINEILLSNKPKLNRDPKLMAQAGRPTRFETATEYYQRKYPGMYFRMCNTNPIIQSDWQSKGLKIHLAEDDKFGAKGEPIRDADLVLMSCPRGNYVENVRKPNKERMDYRKRVLENIQDQFAAEGERVGTETFGKVKSVTTDEA